MKERGRQTGKRRFRSGQWVEFDGLYSDDWGGDLMLLQGESFPVHPVMGDTRWTYAGQPVHRFAKPPKLNGHHISN
ncbi:hypothetical protein [Paenibacillus arenilitoris]|uniref:Uncharacterized protein n=1 Tax=Paenibacillus arenilitoris TaxID=2772299 RepID=A0A927CJL2_9BACL|nr:hypothetical protein [Paenibacillus arenilitoris]MBD2867922.1 hypothetical protein [Paenibacillus arenilitoris]